MQKQQKGEHVLAVISPSHFCEAARWALQFAGVNFVEKQALPGFHIMMLPSKPGTSRKQTPFLLLPNGECLDDSWAIIAYALPSFPPVPAEMKKSLEEVGAATRSIAYSHLLLTDAYDREIVSQGTFFERFVSKIVSWRIQKFMYERMVKDKDYIRLRHKELEEQIAKIEKEIDLIDPATHPTTLNPVNLYVATMMAPVLLPPGYLQGAGFSRNLPLEDQSDSFRHDVEKYRATKLGKFALRIYVEQRDAQSSSSENLLA